MDFEFIRECQKYAARWVADPRNRSWNHDLQKKALLERVQHTSREGLFLGPLSSKMMLIQSWFGMVASAELLADNSAGWISLQASYLYENWMTRLDLGSQAVGRSKARLHVWEHTLGFAHAIAIRDDLYANIQGPAMIESLEGHSTRFVDWEDRFFERFVVILYAMLHDREVASSTDRVCHLGPYQSVIDCWCDLSALRKTLRDLCDLHIEETNDLDTLGHIGSFAKAPYGVFPVEILAIRRVREDLGLPMPEIDHPLMQTMMAHPPAVMPEVHDEVLDQIIAKARQEGIAGDPW